MLTYRAPLINRQRKILLTADWLEGIMPYSSCHFWLQLQILIPM